MAGGGGIRAKLARPEPDTNSHVIPDLIRDPFGGKYGSRLALRLAGMTKKDEGRYELIFEHSLANLHAALHRLSLKKPAGGER